MGLAQRGVYLNYEELIFEAYKEGIIFKELNLSGSEGRCNGNRIAIKKDIPTLKEKACVLAEELGHYHTTVGDIIDLQDVKNRKQELKARLWAYNEQIGLQGIVKAYESGCVNLFEMAEYLDVTESFLNDALKCYHNKYGMCAVLDNYIIYFEPNLGVMRMI